jgi:hypothetical protein
MLIRPVFSLGASKHNKLHMKQNIIFLTIFGLFFSCSQSDKEMANKQSESLTIRNETEVRIDTIASKPERQIIIGELKRLQAVFISNDKQKIADIFSFPITKETLGIYFDNEKFNEQLQENGNKVTRNMFNNFFLDISESLQIDQINQLFKNLNVDKLEIKDNLEYNAIIKTEPCYHFYEVKIENRLVTLTVGKNANKDYKIKSASADEIPENDSSICEHVLWWVFTFDGKQLRFKEISGAG